MDETYIVNLCREIFMTALWIAGPAMVIGMIVGILMALFQAITSVQEQTLTMIPKIMAVGVTLIVMLPFIMHTLSSFTTSIFNALVDVAW
ncbi:MAG: flagellar biosynthetic protein FliQ [Planctomycetes bacterium]|nr:flagellar biosynthetic protein FliQ [Planctomycetota bacterium]